MARQLWVDTETFSPIPITHGTAKYATQADVMLLSWAAGAGQEDVWDATRYRDLPSQFVKDLEDADELWAHNAYFDRSLLAIARWWPKHLAPLAKWRCTMVQAFSHGLPGKLAHLCQIFRLPDDLAKLDGTNYIQLFCKPVGKNKVRNTRESHPEEWKGFMKYALRDIPSMREVHRLCPKWNMTPQQIALWHLDQRRNDRGFAVDVEFAHAAVRETEKEKGRLAERTQEITEYDELLGTGIRATTQRDKLLQYLLMEYGVDLPDLKADTVERRLEDPELPEYVKELLRIRQQASKSSTAKYKRVIQGEVGGRLYGTIQYRAANRTGRMGGRIFQPQNLQRPTHKFPMITAAIDAFKAGDVADFASFMGEEVMPLATSCLRSVIVAPKGKKLVTSDLSNIEGRKLAWLAGEEWKLQAFRDNDTIIGWTENAYGKKKAITKGPDLYKVAYGRSFGVDPESVEDDSDERQIGKVQELALGYQGGVNAFVTMSATYGVDLELMARKVIPHLSPMAYRDAQGVYAWATQQKRTYGLSKDVYIACEALKALWRQAHVMTEILWGAYETAARNAILNPNIDFAAGRCVFRRIKNWLRVQLPSGRFLCYPDPRVEGMKISYANVNVYTKRWHRTYTYGGKIAENIDQASSCDVMTDGETAADEEGYDCVLTVHDELVTEVPDTDEYTHQGLSKILATNKPWNLGLPLAAKGMETYRYRKG